MMQEYKKLVRDRIPDIIRQQGKTPYTEILSDDKYLIELDRKLTEEIEEYQESKDLEELADVLEVIYAICEARGHSIDRLYEIREQKLNKRGGFSKKTLLLSVE